MDIDLIRSAEQFHNRYRRNRIVRKLVSILACVVVFSTTYALILPAITMERETLCGLAEHQHTESCYTRKDVRHLACGSQSLGIHTHTAQCADGSCGYADFVIHEHNSSCYEDGKLVCSLPEVKAHTHTDDCYRIPTWEESGHTHTDECYTVTKGLSCGKTETEGHTHTDACRSQKQVLSCDTPESDGHHHGEGCYDENDSLTCTTPESSGHHHDASCYRTEETMTCDKEESEPHQHTDACYAEEKTLICTEKEGPVVKQGAPELACTMPEIAVHEHSAACFDADNQWICGKTQVLSHAHTDACFETVTEDMLTCGLEEHEHTDECCPKEATSAEIAESTTETAATDQGMDDSQDSTPGGTCSFTVYKPGWSGSIRRMSLRMTAFPEETGTNSNEVELDQYITTVSIQKLVNNVWTDSTQFTDGDAVRVFISYSIDANVVGTNSRTVTYQLPAGVLPFKEESGRVGVNNATDGQTVGSYTIDTDGKITIIFDEGFANNDSFIGSISFEGSVSHNGDGDSSSIVFPGSSSSITIEKKEEETGTSHDMEIQKTGKLNADNTVSYTIEVSTQNGTLENQTITIGDVFETYNGAVMGEYLNDIQVKKVSSGGDGTGTVLTQGTDYDLTSETQNNQNSFEITGLKALKAGEKYVVTYTAQAQAANADGSAMLKNRGYANDGSGDKYAWVDTTISSSWIHKDGWNDANNNLIHWKITINPNSVKNDLVGWTLSDLLGEYEIDWTQVTDFKVIDENWNDVTSTVSLSDPFRATDNGENRNTYYIEYTTPTKDLDEGAKVTNVATLSKDSITYTSPVTVTVSHRNWSVSKSSSGQGSSVNGVREYTWNATVMVPGDEITGFDYVDTIKDPVSSLGGSQEGKHYAIKSDLEEAFCQTNGLYLEMEDTGNSVHYPTSEGADISITVTYFSDIEQTEEVDDDSKPVRSFKVSVQPREGTVITGAKRLVIGKYPTLVDQSGMKIGETWTMSNTGQVGEQTSTSDARYTKPKPLEKTVFGKDQYGNRIYLSDSAALDYDEQGGIIKYRLLWKNLDGTNDDIEITDILPAGMSLSGEVSAAFSNDEATWTWDSKSTYNLKEGQKPIVTQEPLEDGTTQVTVKIQGGHNDDGKNDAIVLFYDVAFQWASLAENSVLFTNRASYGNYETDQSVTVERTIPIVSKNGTQIPQTDNDGKPVLDSEGNPVYTSTVEYSVTINPGALDLKADSDTLTLKDTLTLPNGVQAYLNMESVALYNYSETGENHRGAEVSKQRYQISFDPQTHVLKVSVPDELACVLVYRYEIDKGDTGTVTLSNKAELNGESSSIDGMKFMVSTSEASVLKRGKVTINKVDSEDFTKGLVGAEFLVEQFVQEKDSWVWKPVVKTDETGTENLTPDVPPESGGEDKRGVYTTDDEGKILFFKDRGTALPTMSLIRLTELNAPLGYLKDDTVRYIIIYPNTSSSLATVKTEMSDALTAAGITDDSQVAWYKTGTDVSIFVPNTGTSVQVQKIWLDENNHQITTGMPESVSVQLYRQSMEQRYCTVTVTSAWRSTTDGYWPGSTQTVCVDVGSPLTITELSYDSTDNHTYTVSIDGGTAQSMQFQSGNYVYTVPSIDRDLNIEITNYKNGARTEFTLSGYRDPGWAAVGEGASVGDVVILNSENDWFHTWGELQELGEGEYYVVKELDVPGGYSVTYTNNGIKKGEITISNRKQKPEYTLPETGGRGTEGYILGGFTLTAGAALWLLCRRKRRREAV